MKFPIPLGFLNKPLVLTGGFSLYLKSPTDLSIYLSMHMRACSSEDLLGDLGNFRPMVPMPSLSSFVQLKTMQQQKEAM